MSLRRLAKSFIRKAGYQIHPASRSCVLQDPFIDQQALLSQAQVKTIFDVGANSGQTTSRYRALFPDAMIYSFEPFAEPFMEMQREFGGDPAIRPVQFAVSDHCGRKDLFVNQSSLTNSLLASVETTGVYENVGTTEVDVTTIDDFCKRETVADIHILKMDIQGGELMALRGARQMLATKRIHLIYSEVLFAPLYKSQAQFYEICELLFEFSYSLFDFYNLVHMENGQLAWGDAIFLSPQIRAAISPTCS